MNDNQVPMFAELPADQATPLKKVRRKVNDVQESLLYIMEKRELTLSKIQRETEIPWGTIMGWHDGQVNSMQLDHNFFRLWMYLKCSLEFLCFGIGDEDTTIDSEKLDLLTKIGEYRSKLTKMEKELIASNKELQKLKLYIEAHIPNSA